MYFALGQVSRCIGRCPRARPLFCDSLSIRCLMVDSRNRLSWFFAPSGGVSVTNLEEKDDESIHSLLLRTGYLRQAHSGIFHLLPLGLRVQEKLERLIDKHMRSIGASRLELSSITSEKIWQATGRLERGGAELMRFKDRKGAKLLLAPTHEEEVTALVASLVNSHKQLPLRLYQITRKYRDERRPRAGLLRGREFTMKDLYTFDATEEDAIRTYGDVRQAYKALLDDLGLPYIVAEASSGDMGGSLSHEYLYPSTTGEDTIISCSHCSYSANQEVAQLRPAPVSNLPRDPHEIAVHHSITTDRKILINTYYLRKSNTADASLGQNEVNLHRIKELVPNLDPGVGYAVRLFEEHFVAYTQSSEPGTFSQIFNLFDGALPYSVTEASFSNHTDHADASHFIADKRIPTTSISRHPETNEVLWLLKARPGDSCPRCEEGQLRSTTAIELGHTFHLGTRYTKPLSAHIFNEETNKVFMQQGCHGLGVSRMIPAIAEGYRDAVGLSWPKVVAPFEVCILTHPEEDKHADGVEVYDSLTSRNVDGIREGVDCIFDDREKPLVWKMKDADLVGYPIVCILGKAWKDKREVEIQCRRKGLKTQVPLGSLPQTVNDILEGL